MGLMIALAPPQPTARWWRLKIFSGNWQIFHQGHNFVLFYGWTPLGAVGVGPGTVVKVPTVKRSSINNLPPGTHTYSTKKAGCFFSFERRWCTQFL